jgi:hypothetical protein
MRNEAIYAIVRATAALAVAMSLFGCSKEEGRPEAASHSASVSSAVAAPPSAPPTQAVAPVPTPSAATGPVHECPKGTTGDGTFGKPCEAKGRARMMEVVWTGKTDEKGPHFRVANKSSTAILYGKVLIYFYDKAGKQLPAKETSNSAPKPYLACAGNMFGGVVKPDEKPVPVFTFSCFNKEQVPEGTATIEGEMQVVGFADSTEKKSEYYWRNTDLTPDARKKGGIK